MKNIYKLQDDLSIGQFNKELSGLLNENHPIVCQMIAMPLLRAFQVRLVSD